MKPVSTLRSLPDETLRQVVGALPEEIKEVLFVHQREFFIAGGAIRAIIAGEPVKDIDIFTTSLDAVPQAIERYLQEFTPWGCWKESKTPCTRTVTISNCAVPPVQFVNNIAYESPEHCVRQFDFTICQAALWHNGDEWCSLCSHEFLRDVAAKQLVYTSPDRLEAPGGSLWRAFKYAQRGYSISQSELARIVLRLNEKLCTGDVEINPWTHYKRPTHNLTAIEASFRMPGTSSTY